jgi:hypothetical protein
MIVQTRLATAPGTIRISDHSNTMIRSLPQPNSLAVVTHYKFQYLTSVTWARTVARVSNGVSPGREEHNE